MKLEVRIVDDNGYAWTWDEEDRRLNLIGDNTPTGGYTCLSPRDVADTLLGGGFITEESYKVLRNTIA